MALLAGRWVLLLEAVAIVANLLLKLAVLVVTAVGNCMLGCFSLVLLILQLELLSKCV